MHNIFLLDYRGSGVSCNLAKDEHGTPLEFPWPKSLYRKFTALWFQQQGNPLALKKRESFFLHVKHLFPVFSSPQLTGHQKIIDCCLRGYFKENYCICSLLELTEHTI